MFQIRSQFFQILESSIPPTATPLSIAKKQHQAGVKTNFNVVSEKKTFSEKNTSKFCKNSYFVFFQVRNPKSSRKKFKEENKFPPPHKNNFLALKTFFSPQKNSCQPQNILSVPPKFSISYKFLPISKNSSPHLKS